MNLRARVAVYGLASVLVAAAVIAASGPLGISPSGGVFTPSERGTLSVLLTDPPVVPEGVSAVFITYSSLRVHVGGLPNSSGWVTLDSQGTINTMGLVNFSQTISSSSIPTGSYNLLSFTIDSATVTFDGANYSATVRNGVLLVPLLHGLAVNSSEPSTALIDIQPTVVNFGSQTAPQFVINTVAKAAQVPARQLEPDASQVGHKMELQAKGWFTEFQREDNYTMRIDSATLTSNSFSVSVTGGSQAVTLKMVVISQEVQRGRASFDIPALGDSAVFAVLQNGTLRQVTSPISFGDDNESGLSIFTSSGYALAAGASITFSFSGAVTFPQVHGSGTPAGYSVTVIGDQSTATYFIQA
jgi:Domain of unknown function (DUF4382)